MKLKKMQDENVIVKYVSIKTCFVQVPITRLQKSSQVAAVKLSGDGKQFYLSASQFPSPQIDSLCISATLGKCLQIKEGAEVNVTYIPDAPALTKISLRPFNSADWHIVNLQAERIQATLLDQITIVAPNQPIVVWLSKHLNVTLLVESISPPFLYGRLENYTEVYVHDESLHKVQADTFTQKITSHSWKENETDCEIFLKSYKYQELPTIFRVCPVSLNRKYGINEGTSEAEITSPHNIFLSTKQLTKLFPDRPNYSMIYGKIQSIFQDKQSTNLHPVPNGQNDEVPSRLVSLSSVENFFNKKFIGTNIDKNIWISDGLRTELNLQLGSKVYIEPITIAENTISSIELLSPPNVNANSLETCFRNYVKQHSTRSDLMLSQHATISLEDKKCRINLQPASPYALLNDSKLRNLGISVTEQSGPEAHQELPQQECFSSKNICTTFLKSNLADAVRVLQMSLTPQTHPFHMENILICGDVGTGKTTFVNLLKDELQNPPNFLHTSYVDCKKLKGRKVDAVAKFFISTLQDCVYCQPSVLLLDNLESITSYATDNDENSPDAINAVKISECLSGLLTVYQSTHLISVVATCTRMDKLGSALRPARGVHVFQTILNVPALSAEERIYFLRFYFRTKKIAVSNKINWQIYGGKTEGWVLQDLTDLCERSLFFNWKRQSGVKVHLEDEDLSKALSVMKPLSLYGVSLFTGEGSKWTDIGGLEKVKETLKELLQWPLIYPGLFAKAPVRHQTGILLYGMPGTGKTMLAGAIAKECGVNFISIKGPELLSKYIGASEEAVRSVFEKAERIKPCIVFFDEFESLAPRRGHDSTGVTDRVVNQLLTQFDGVEGRDGVAIVAASSRPDLLDPALLRPGRLDKSLLCPLPDEQTRATILDTLCKRYGVDGRDLDLMVLVKMTSGFTGADLNAILTQARLNAVEQHWVEAREDKTLEGVRVTQEMLIRSAEDSQPSLTATEISMFNRIYNRFSNGDNLLDGLRENQRATLA